MSYRIYEVISKEALRKTVNANGEPECGKAMTQAGHAVLHCFWDAEKRFPEAAQAYKDSLHAYKITMVVDTEADLLGLVMEYQASTGVTVVKDAGFTVYEEPTVTMVGIGPITKERADQGSLGKLKLFRKWPK